MLPFCSLFCLALLHSVLCNPVQRLRGPSRWSVALNSFNSTSASDIDFKLDFEFNPPLPRTRYLGEWGPFKTIASGLEAAREHGLEERLPREGYLVESDGVWLHAYPLFIDYTWGLMALTLRQVAADLETKGKFACRWELSRIDDGRLGRIYGRGDMWPGLSRKENAVRTA